MGEVIRVVELDDADKEKKKVEKSETEESVDVSGLMSWLSTKKDKDSEIFSLDFNKPSEDQTDIPPQFERASHGPVGFVKRNWAYASLLVVVALIGYKVADMVSKPMAPLHQQHAAEEKPLITLEPAAEELSDQELLELLKK